ncbi:MAG: hypothetical protein ACOCV1_06560 [Bacillota bacterium]
MEILRMFFDSNNPLSPKLWLLMWFSIPYVLAYITYKSEKSSEKKYKYYQNDFYSQWRKFK